MAPYAVVRAGESSRNILRDFPEYWPSDHMTYGGTDQLLYSVRAQTRPSLLCNNAASAMLMAVMLEFQGPYVACRVGKLGIGAYRA